MIHKMCSWIHIILQALHETFTTIVSSYQRHSYNKLVYVFSDLGAWSVTWHESLLLFMVYACVCLHSMEVRNVDLLFWET